MWICLGVYYVRYGKFYKIQKWHVLKELDTPFSYYVLFHVLGLNRIRTGNISNRPSIIVSVRITFENWLYPAKLEYGPTASNAGPTLDMQVSTAEKLLKNPCFTVYSPASDTILKV